MSTPAIVKIVYEGKKVRLAGWTTGARGGYSMSTYQMLQIGSFANKTVIERTRTGRGSDGSMMKPLSTKKWALRNRGKFVKQMPGYAASKIRKGLQGIRDCWGDGKQGGHMLDNSSVRFADQSSAVISFTSTKARVKAHANEQRSPFYGFSESDRQKIVAFAATLFQQNVRAVADVFTGRKAA